MADEKKTAPAAATAQFKVTHGTVTLGYTPMGERKTVAEGETFALSPAEAQPMLDVGTIEAA